jgi:phosphoglycolate phosphatase
MTNSGSNILLDLDGTLIDSAPGIHSSCRAALQALGHLPPPAIDFSGMIGPPIEEIMSKLLARYGDDRVSEGVAAYRVDYSERGLFGSSIYPGVVEALEAMRRASARLFIATSKRRRFAVRIIENLGLIDVFEGVHGSEDDGSFDHKSALIAHVLARHKLTVERSVMVGDRKHDVAGAQANSVRSLGVLWGYGTRDELEAAGANAVIANPSELAFAAFKQTSGSF